jgi:HlyD family secretion protein
MKRPFNFKSAGKLLLVAALFAVPGCSKHSIVTTLETAVVRRGNLTQKITATGLISALKSVDVGSQISGRIQALFVDFNSPVTNGQVVAQIDPSTYQANVNQTQGNLNSAKAALELAQINERREKQLLDEKLISQSEYDQSIASLHQAEASVEIWSASLESARANLNYCTIISPVDGVVISRKLDVGQTVAATFNTPVLFTIANDLTKMNIDASIAESDIGHVKDGQMAEFTVDAFPDDVFQGKVVQVRKAPSTVNNVVTYNAIITVDNPGQKLFPGMTATVSITVAERKDVLKIPNAALRFVPPEDVKVEGAGKTSQTGQNAAPMTTAPNQRVVYISAGTPKEPRLKAARVKVGVDDGAETEVIEGLREGEIIVTAALSPADKRQEP